VPTSESPACGQNRRGAAVSGLFVCFVLVASDRIATAASASPDLDAEPSAAAFTAPRRGQIDLSIDDLASFPSSGSYVRVRENQIHGTRLRFISDLGINTVQIPELWATYWFNEHDSIQLQFHYFVAEGSKQLTQDVFYNGATIAGGQTLDSSGSPWATLGLYYQRLIFPPESGFELRAKIGAQFTYLDFDLGHPRLTPDTVGTETKEDFNTQELPIPTLGIEGRAPLTDHLSFDTVALGGWLNHVDSLRTEGGTVYLSQTEAQVHAHFTYADRALLGPVHAFVGLGYFLYQQDETSHEDGNFIRLSTWGPELGFSVSF